MYNVNIGVPPAISAASYSMTVPAQSNSYQFYMVMYAAPSALYSNLVSGTGLWFHWISSWSGAGGISHNGPYSGTQPTDNAGNNANPATGDTAAPTDYLQTVTLNNSQGSGVAGYQVQMVDSIGHVLGNKNYFLQPNTSLTLAFHYSVPFSILVFQLHANDSFDDQGNATGTNWTRTSSNPLQTIPAQGVNTPPTNTPTIEQTSSNNNATPSATAANEQAQVQQGADQITGALKDNTSQSLQNGQTLQEMSGKLTGANGKLDQLHTDITSEISKLGEIKTGIGTGNDSLTSIGGKIDGTNTALDGVGDKIGLTNGKLDGISDKLGEIADKLGDNTSPDGSPQDLADSIAPDDQANSFGQAMFGRFTSVKNAVTNLWQSLGLASDPGSAPLSFSIPLPIGSCDLNLESIGGSTLDAIRRFELFWLSIGYVLTVSRIARSAFI